MSIIKERREKTFQCNFAAGPQPRELLAPGAQGIKGITDKTTGRPIWNLQHGPMPLAGQPGAFYIFGTSTYRVASLTETVSLTMGAIPQGADGTMFITVFEDSMGWEIVTSEQTVDMSMFVIARDMDRVYPENGGWRITTGQWRFGHRFAAAHGTPPPPPDSMQSRPPVVWPDNFFSNPQTVKLFQLRLSGMMFEDLLNLAAAALREVWRVDFQSQDVNGQQKLFCVGDNELWPEQGLGVLMGCDAHSNESMLFWVLFADTKHWTSHEARAALDYSVGLLNTALRTRFPGVSLQARH